jgi:hypothetical protein
MYIIRPFIFIHSLQFTPPVTRYLLIYVRTVVVWFVSKFERTGHPTFARAFALVDLLDLYSETPAKAIRGKAPSS